MALDETSLPFLAGTQAEVSSALRRFKGLLCDKFSLSGVSILGWEELEGGAIQKNWRLRLKVTKGDEADRFDLQLLLRQESKSGIAGSLKKEQEFNLLSFLYQKGLQVPEPCFYQQKTAGLPRDILVMSYREGTAESDKILGFSTEKRRSLAQSLMVQLARLHGLDRQTGPNAGGMKGPGFGREKGLRCFISHFFAQSKANLEYLGGSPLVLMAAERWAAQQDDRVLGPEKFCLVHGDFRTGNYLSSSDGRLQAVLDWEFAGTGPAASDLGWFTSPMWRYGRAASPAGGLCDYESLLQAYHAAGGAQLSLEILKFWQVIAMVKWLVIAHQQGDRFFTQGDHDPELALTGLVRPLEVEQWLLMAIMPDQEPRSFDPAPNASDLMQELLLAFWAPKIRKCKAVLAMTEQKRKTSAYQRLASIVEAFGPLLQAKQPVAYQRLASIVEAFGPLLQAKQPVEKVGADDVGLNELWQANGWALQLFSPEAIGGVYCRLATGEAISAAKQP